jgi:hypothetical protein
MLYLLLYFKIQDTTSFGEFNLQVQFLTWSVKGRLR